MAQLNSFLVILIVGGLIMLSLILLTNPMKVNRVANRWFSAFLLVWCSFWFEEILLLSNGPTVPNYLNHFIRFAQTFTPFFLYMSVQVFTHPTDYRSPKTKWIVAASVVVGIVQVVVGMQEGGAIFSGFLLIFYSLALLVLVWKMLLQHNQNIQLLNSSVEEIDLIWIRRILQGIICLCLFMVVHNLLFQDATLGVFANGVMFLFVFYIGHFVIQQREIFHINTEEFEQIIPTTTPSASETKTELIPQAQLMEFKEELSEHMKANEPFLNPEISLQKLAQEINITPHQLSYILNVGFEQNFYQFINGYRIRKAQEMLLNPDQKLTIAGISQEVGFNSKTTFNTVFKKLTNTTPSQYKQGV